MAPAGVLSPGRSLDVEAPPTLAYLFYVVIQGLYRFTICLSINCHFFVLPFSHGYVSLIFCSRSLHRRKRAATALRFNPVTSLISS